MKTIKRGCLTFGTASFIFIYSKSGDFAQRGSNTLKRIEEIGNLPKSAKEQIYLVIDALVRDFKAK